MCLWLPAYSRTALSSKPILSPKWCLYYINGASIHVTVVCIRSGHLIWANKSEPSPWFRNSEQWVSEMKGCVDSGLRALSEPWRVIREIFLLREAEKWGRYGKKKRSNCITCEKWRQSWENGLAFLRAACAERCVLELLGAPDSCTTTRQCSSPSLKSLHNRLLSSAHTEKLWLKHCTSAGSGLHQGPTNVFARILQNSENTLSPHIF